VDGDPGDALIAAAKPSMRRVLWAVPRGLGGLDIVAGIGGHLAAAASA
jgi:hypothetical protein